MEMEKKKKKGKKKKGKKKGKEKQKGRKEMKLSRAKQNKGSQNKGQKEKLEKGGAGRNSISGIHMVDVSPKRETLRVAEAQGKISLSPETLRLILENKIPKGDVLTTARLAGIQGAKRASDLIPLCHPLRLTSIEVEISPVAGESSLLVSSRVSALDRTGVEMEALTAVALACLTIYDMVKALDKRMIIGDIHLISKSGGKSGPFKW
jgi:cyclic pyranopterin phosphate synthase